MNITEIATKRDIEILLKEIRELKVSFETLPDEKQFLRTGEVKKLLGISNSTIQRLRINGVITPSKIGGTWYYKLSEIKKLIP
ncbi:helix-turn-helix domain-containing protein [Sediminibacterium sp.]|uniref:helix-turn-helix domain-containing protein n=1 Tax=Sediminibacterium sp. TaxID=1917865 RepID=UPI0025DADC2F|nr:helix-turn-helix domain-containing protein [Sediminibacterium sp.]MBW0177630.1 helix-turn-helix domain-containing protein [Sediminibacterium sp.]